MTVATDVRPVVDSGSDGRRALRVAAWTVLVVVAYLACGVGAYWPVLPGISHHLFSVDGDFTLTVWFLGWVPHALLHGQNPFFSNAMFVPTGVNLAQNTEGPFLGLLAAPVTLLVGPIVSANLLMVVAMPVSAASAFGVLRAWRVVLPAAAFGGLLYGFSPYMVGQGVGHPVLLFLPFPPLIAWMVVRIAQGRGSPVRSGVGLGLLLVAQYLTSQEVLATVVAFVVLALVCVAVRRPAGAGALARRLAVPGAVALVVAVAVLAYPVWMLLDGPQHATGTTLPADVRSGFHTDLASLAVPGPLQRLAAGTRGLGARLLVGNNPTEAGGYVGIPLLVVTAVLGWRSRRSPRMQLVLVLLAAALAGSLGSRLTVDGHHTALALPFALVDHVPLLDNMLAGRLSFEVDAFLASAVAFGFDDVATGARGRHAHGRHRERASAGAVALCTAGALVVVVSLLPAWPYAKTPARVLPPAVQDAVPAGDPVAVTYPYDTDYLTQPLLWQADAGFTFRLLGGYALHPGPGGGGTTLPARMSPPGLQEFLAGQEGIDLYGPPLPVAAPLVAATRAAFARYGIRLAIVDETVPGSAGVAALLDRAVGPPRTRADGFALWTGG